MDSTERNSAMGTTTLYTAPKKLLKFTILMIMFLFMMATWSCKTCNCPAYTYEKSVPTDTELHNDHS